jgi:hypothetical protein
MFGNIPHTYTSEEVTMSKTTNLLQATATRISQEILDELAKKRKEAEDVVSQRQAEQARIEAERRREEVEIGMKINKRVLTAEKGLARLLELGKHKDVQAIIAAFKAGGGTRHLTFLSVKRASGDDWCKDPNGTDNLTGDTVNVEITLDTDTIEVLCGGRDGGKPFGDSWSIPYDRDASVKQNGDSKGISIEDFLREIADTDPCNMALVHNVWQRSFEWNASSAAFQFFVSSARKERFERYVKLCLEQL